ncbi:tetratricopeptide repeat protein [Desulfoluna spongiiphila]|uniref:Tfp pilus assembly protein PilF n=1 Tax=Desulfoluna spongiiphila TaxID=419481 RepID=A0A1G5BZW8_9BACT|nr:tetratricopeptide repeat protein [Desulfoluna spongiiphila]SCX95673.1 Tfp pilus assembly protein PilF [Desulfoluna spongiiphila]
MVVKRFALTLCVLVFVVTACATDSEKRDAYFEKGRSYVDEGNVKEALLAFKNCVQIDPTYSKGWYEIATIAIQQGDPKRAFRAYLKVVEKDPGHSEAHFNLARLYLLAKKTEEARNHIDKALAGAPENLEYLMVSAAVFSVNGQDKEALASYDRVFALNSKDIRPLLGVARLKTRARDFKGAEEVLRKASAIAPEAIRPRLELVNLLTRSKQFEKAEIELKAIVAANSDNAGLLIVLGDFYSARKKYAKAEIAYRDAVAKDPTAFRPVMKLARYYEKRDDVEKAEAMYLKALALKPDDGNAEVTVARFYANRGDLEKAGEMIARTLEASPGFLPALSLRGELELRQGRFGDALETFTVATKEDTTNANLFYLKGVSGMGLGKNDLARKDVLKALELKPNHLKARVALAELYLRDREFQLAKESLEKVLAVSPDLYKANLLMADALGSLGENAEAQLIYTRLKQQGPDSPVVFFRSGTLHMAEGELSLAMDDFERARAINPGLMDVFGAMIRCRMMNDEESEALDLCREQLKVVEKTPAALGMVHGMMGDIYAQMGDLKKAEGAYLTAINVSPEITRPYYGLASVYHKQGNTDKVVAQLKGLSEKRPKDPMPHVLMGILSEGSGDVETAKASYRHALSLRGDIVAATNNLAYILADANEKIDEALELARMAKSKASDDPSVMDTLGLVYYRKGLYDSAISEFKDSLAKLPENAMVNYHLGLALHANGDVEKAKDSFQKALDISEDFKGSDTARELLAQY